MDSHRITTNGTVRTFTGKMWPSDKQPPGKRRATPAVPEFRVYIVNGDVSDREELAEAVQDLGATLNCNVRMML